MNYIDMPNVLEGPRTEQAISDKNDKAIQNSIYNILSTSVGTIPGHPLFGCSLTQYLFQALDPLTSTLIQKEVDYAIKLWEPRVSIIRILVKDDIDYNRIAIKMYYSITSDPNNTEREYIFNTQK